MEEVDGNRDEEDDDDDDDRFVEVIVALNNESKALTAVCLQLLSWLKVALRNERAHLSARDAFPENNPLNAVTNLPAVCGNRTGNE